MTLSLRSSRSWVLLVPLLTLAACGDPRDKTLPLGLSTAPETREILVQLTPPEQQAVARYEIRRATRLAQGDDSARKSVTYRQAIADQLVYDTAEDQEAAAARVKAQARQAETDSKEAAAKATDEADKRVLNTSVACQIKDKGINPVPKADTPSLPWPMASYVLACHNASGAEVRGFKGNLFLKGPFGEMFAALPVRHDEPLPSDGTFEVKTNQPFVSMDPGVTAQAFHDLPVEKISVQVQLDSLILADGQLINRRQF